MGREFTYGISRVFFPIVFSVVFLFGLVLALTTSRNGKPDFGAAAVIFGFVLICWAVAYCRLRVWTEWYRVDDDCLVAGVGNKVVYEFPWKDLKVRIRQEHQKASVYEFSYKWESFAINASLKDLEEFRLLVSEKVQQDLPRIGNRSKEELYNPYA